MKLFVRDRNFYLKVAVIAIPAILQGLITIGINMMDTIMLGSLGEAQLSASSLANQFYSIFQILCLGIGGGAAVMTAQYWGSNNREALKKVITLTLRLVLIVSIGFIIATYLWPNKIMGFYTPEETIVDYGVKYFTILGSSYLFMGGTIAVTIILRSVGSVHIPLIASICSLIINISLNWIFIFGNLGAPRMEIAGAALATLIARLFEFVLILGHFFFFDRKIHYKLRNILTQCRDQIKEFLFFSFPVIVSDLLLALGNNMVAVVMGHIGSSFVSANAITIVVVQLSTVFIRGLSSSSSVITGNTLGKKKVEQAYRQGITFFVLSAIIGIMAAIIIAIITPFMISLYNITEETKQITNQLMVAVVFIVPFQCISSVMTKGVLRGGGDTRFLVIADVLFLWVASVPLGYIAGIVLGLPAFWIYIFLKIDMIIKTIWCVGRLKSKKWMKIV